MTEAIPLDLSTKTVCVIDFGNFIGVAVRLSKDFGRTLYWNPFSINGFPEHNAYDIGRGVEGIIKVRDWEDFYEEIDLFVFPDLYYTGLQELLRRNGKAVFGSGRGSDMETNRGEMKRLQIELGLATNEYEEVEGLYQLEERLKVLEDRYIKSSLRGDSETFHHINYVLSKEELKAMKHRMGIYDKKEKYIIESPIESVAEIGIDTMTCMGVYLKESCTGIEIKDAGYIGRMTKYYELPEQIRIVTDKLSPVFASYDYRGSYSNEIRVDKNGVGYLIDQTCRAPSPPTSLILCLYENFSEIIWSIANNIIPEVKYKYKWGVQFVIKSEMAQTEPVAIQFPAQYREYIDIKNLVVDDDGTFFFTPNNVPMKEIGAVSGCGNTMKEAISMATEIARSIKGFDIKINIDCIEDAMEQIQNLRKAGINYLS